MGVAGALVPARAAALEPWLWMAGGGGIPGQPGPLASDPLEVDPERRSVSLDAVAQPSSFRASTPPDHRYHALVSGGGSASGASLLVTDTDDLRIAAALRELGAMDGGGVPMAAWTLRRLPFVPQPSRRVSGSLVRVQVEWSGSGGPRDLADLLDDPGGRGVEMRFGGNEAQNHHWESGCIVCLYSCPGGVISNAAYTIRDHQRGTTHFDPSPLCPPDGTPVRVHLSLTDEATAV